MKKITAFKAFDKDLKCRGFQFKVGETYTLPSGEVPQMCNVGFHACELPFDTLNYYSDIINNRYAEVELSGKIDKSDNDKLAAQTIVIKKEITFKVMIKAQVDFLLKAVFNKKTTTKKQADDYAQIGSSGDSSQIGSSGYSSKIGSSGYSSKIGSSGDYAQIGSSGDYAQIGSSGYSSKIGSSGDYAQIGSSGYSSQIGSSGDSSKIGSSGDSSKIGSSGDYAQIGSSGDYAQIGSSGDYAQIGSSGDSSQIGSSGYYAQIKSEGNKSVVSAIGINSVISAKKGSWIVLAEYDSDYNPICVKTEKVDGRVIKEDVLYKLKNGKFVTT